MNDNDLKWNDNCNTLNKITVVKSKKDSSLMWIILSFGKLGE